MFGGILDFLRTLSVGPRPGLQCAVGGLCRHIFRLPTNPRLARGPTLGGTNANFYFCVLAYVYAFCLTHAVCNRRSL